jgi:hypothetical protein
VHTQVTLLGRGRNEDGAGLRREADVAMMEPTDFGNLDNRPRGRGAGLGGRRAHPCRARDACEPGDSRRSSG